MSQLLRELQEPRPGGAPCLPWLGEANTKDKIVLLCAQGHITIDVCGRRRESVKEGELEGDALRRMRDVLSISGRDLDETRLRPLQPEPQTRGLESVEDGQHAVLLGRSAEVDIARGAEEGLEKTSDIFAEPVRWVPCFSEATSSLNLLLKTESWGIVRGTAVRECSLEIEDLTGDQLDQLLKILPDGLTYALRLKIGEK